MELKAVTEVFFESHTRLESITWSWKSRMSRDEVERELRIHYMELKDPLHIPSASSPINKESITWSWKKQQSKSNQLRLKLQSLNPLHGVERTLPPDPEPPNTTNRNPLHGVESPYPPWVWTTCRSYRRIHYMELKVISSWPTSRSRCVLSESITWSWKNMRSVPRGQLP